MMASLEYGWIRTNDQMNQNHLLYHLSYPRNKSVARPERIELPYSCYSFDDRLEGG